MLSDKIKDKHQVVIPGALLGKARFNFVFSRFYSDFYLPLLSITRRGQAPGHATDNNNI